MNIVILMGPPGAGKGTVSEGMVNTGFSHVSTGELLREEISRKTPLGIEAKKLLDQGLYASDDVVIAMVRDLLNGYAPDSRILFDGFPRTLNQAAQLDEMIASSGGTLSDVILLECPDVTIINRISGRRTCETCGSVYNIKYKPAAVCGKDGGTLVQRPDDDERTVKKRLEIYNEMTHPLIDYYKGKDVLRRINADREIETVQDEVLSVLR